MSRTEIRKGPGSGPREGEAAMRTLPLAAIVGALMFGSYVLAQEKPVYTSEAMLRRIARDTAVILDVGSCVLPDKTERAVNTSVTVDGRTFRCVEVLDRNFRRRGVAWTPVLDGRAP
jgi:hypothetical protein